MRAVATTRNSEPTAPAAGRATQQHKARHGYTLLEMVISTGAATVLLGGLMSTIVVANRAWSPDLKPAIKTEASGLTRQLGIDLKSALYFTERTSTAVTFAVPDRDSDGQPERLRYVWSGTAGDPLTVSLNGGPAQTVVADVQTFNMDFLLRAVTAPVIPIGNPDPAVMFLTELTAGQDGEVERDSLSDSDKERVAAIESWGFSVTVVSGYASDADWAAQIDNAEAIYVPGSVDDQEISKRLFPLNVGTVFEYASQRDEAAFSTTWNSTSNTDIDLENTWHYITQTLSPGDVPVVSSSQPLLALSPTLGPDLEVLARSMSSTYQASLAVLERNARTNHADPVAARRVFLPWGGSTAFSQLTTSALTIMERSISWAAGLDDPPVRRRVLYFVRDIASHDSREFDRKIMFESAGLEVRKLSESSSADVIANEIANSHAIYLPAYVSTDGLLPHVNDVSQGVMTEGLDWTVPLGFSTGQNKSNVTTLDIKETDHAILDGFNGTSITVLNGNAALVTPGGTLADGAVTVLEAPGKGKAAAVPSVVVIEQGGLRADGTAAPGRRTFIPYYNILRSDLTEDGYRLLQQTMDWTAADPSATSTTSSNSSSSNSFFQRFAQ